MIFFCFCRLRRQVHHIMTSDQEFDSDCEHEFDCVAPTRRSLTIVRSAPERSSEFVVLGKARPSQTKKIVIPSNSPVCATLQQIDELDMAFEPDEKRCEFTIPCKFGDDCPLKNATCTYAHNKTELRVTCCEKHLTLKFPSTCSLFHSNAELLDDYYVRVFTRTTKISPFTQLCRFGQKCRKPNCYFAHSHKELCFKMCSRGQKCNRNMCCFIHDDESHSDAQVRMQRLRENALAEELNRFRLQFREDSELCRKYVMGDLDITWDLSRIVQRMCQMKFLFEYTPFRTEYKKMKETNSKITFEDAEKAVMIQTVGSERYPPGLWPWLL